MTVSRRQPPNIGNLLDLHPREAMRQIEVFIKWARNFYDSIPGGFLESDPTTINAGDSADPGTETASWAAADHEHAVETGAPSHPTGTAASEGSGTALMRADATIQQGIVTTKGDLLGHSTVPARVAVGLDGQVLTAEAAQATGVKWAPAGGSSSGTSSESLSDYAIFHSTVESYALREITATNFR